MPLARDSNHTTMQAAQWGTSQVVAIGAASTASTTFTTINAYDSRGIRIAATVDCYVSFGTAPTATTTTSAFLPAGMVEYVSVPDGCKVACITATGGVTGTLSVTEVI